MAVADAPSVSLIVELGDENMLLCVYDDNSLHLLTLPDLNLVRDFPSFHTLWI